MTDGKPQRPSRARLDAASPNDLILRAVNCLGWARRDCTAHGVWRQYDDGGIVSVRGDQGRETAAVCTDAEGNGLWIALMSPSIGNALEYLLLNESARLENYKTWEETGERLGATHMLALLVVERYYDLIGVPESDAY